MAKRDSFLLRLSPEVLDSIRRWADDELRSANAQIEMILTRALRDAGRLPKSTPEQLEKTIPASSNDSEKPPS
ncbi:MAG: Arc family DNA-binding protein, partial [Pirellula sp.]